MGVAAHYDFARQRSYVDNAARALLAHNRRDRAQHTDSAKVIGLENLADYLQWRFLYRPAVADAGVVYQGVDATASGHDLFDRGVDSVRLQQVQLNHLDGQTLRRYVVA